MMSSKVFCKTSSAGYFLRYCTQIEEVEDDFMLSDKRFCSSLGILGQPRGMLACMLKSPNERRPFSWALFISSIASAGNRHAAGISGT